MQPIMSMTKEEIAEAIQSFLSRCSIPYQRPQMDEPLLQLCYNEATKRGYMVEGDEELKPFIPQGLAIAFTAYAHLDITMQVWIALTTAGAIYCDDRLIKDTSSINVFWERLFRGERQADRALNAFADLILEARKYFPRLTANLIASSVFDFMNSIILDKETLGMEVSPAADNYPTFTRTLSGVAQLYALAIFPAEIEVDRFIQAVPSIMTYISDANDIFSFYKEELAGENVNYVSLWAKSRGCDKIQALYGIIQETAEAHEKVIRILEGEPAALEAYYNFAYGYVGFHTVLDRRYRLDELMLS
ncbi:hypothetical protein D9757_004431 [Collybiopsis confluens]|uniref:Terpenoid synthase n=1 Tax=Collybiopsis confluens TaxID=2823264 RepID=A0A8H5HWT4_9AGAR|nr:hypothetical protein D9757_004431 [Collybiopsis confluens]